MGVLEVHASISSKAFQTQHEVYRHLTVMQ